MGKLGEKLQEDVSRGNTKIIKEDFGRIVSSVNMLIGEGNINSYMFIALKDYRVLKISEVHATEGKSEGEVKVTIKKVLDAMRIDDVSTVDLLGETKIDLKGEAGIIQSPLLTNKLSDLLVNKNDMLAAVFTGDLAGLTGGVITVELEQV